MNKKIIIGIAITAIIISSIGVIDALKTTLGDESIELPGEEGIEKTLNLQESGQSSESGESAEDEANERGGG